MPGKGYVATQLWKHKCGKHPLTGAWSYGGHPRAGCFYQLYQELITLWWPMQIGGGASCSATPTIIELAGLACCPYIASPNVGGSSSRATTTVQGLQAAWLHGNTVATREPCYPCHCCSYRSSIPALAYFSSMVSFTSTDKPSCFPEEIPPLLDCSPVVIPCTATCRSYVPGAAIRERGKAWAPSIFLCFDPRVFWRGVYE